MDFERLALLFEQLEKTSSGNDVRSILSSFFKEVPSSDIKVVVYLLLGRLGPEYDTVVLGLAEKSVLKAIAKAGGVSEKSVLDLVRTIGDAGLIAEKILTHKSSTLFPTTPLSINDLYSGLVKISLLDGTGSSDLKINVLVSLFSRCSTLGAKYVTRVALGILRLGVAEMSVVDSLAIAFIGEKKDKEYVERAYNICPDLGIIAEVLAISGLAGINSISVEVGRPVKMMLAQRIEELDDIESKMPGSILVEAKYDGERVQVHKLANGCVVLFSRRHDTITLQFPDLVTAISQYVKCNSCIVEGEILALGEDGRPLPFQTLMQRRRKYNVAEYATKVPVILKLFDVLYVDSKLMMDKALTIRKKALTAIVKKGGPVGLAENIVTDDIHEMDLYFRSMLERGFEGVIFKSLGGEYQAGTRGWNWIKWKKEYVGSLSDSFDVVVVGAFFGRGKRKGMYGALLCAVRNSVSGIFESFCKLGTGLTDETLLSLPFVLDVYRVKKCPSTVVSGVMCDVWFDPQIVVEVSGAEITKSPIHSCGYALRFPRFIRFREKKAIDATTVEEVKGMVK